MEASVLNLPIKSVVRIIDHLYQVHSLTQEGKYNFICLSANDNVPPLVKSGNELVKLYATNNFEVLRDAYGKVDERRKRYLDVPFEKWPKHIQDYARLKYRFVKAFVNSKARRRTDKILRPIIQQVAKEYKCEEIPTSRLRRWIREWESIGSPDLRDIRIFVPRYHDRGKNRQAFHYETEKVVDEVIKDWFLCEQPKSLTEIWGEIKRRNELIDASDIDPKFKDGNVLRSPSEATVWRRLSMVDYDVKVLHQEGADAWERKCKPYIRGPQATRPMEFVEIDHTDVDVWLIDYFRKVPLGRPYLTLAIDRYTRMIVGFYISFKKPDAVTVMKCLYHTIMPKEEWLRGYPKFKNEWPACGRMMTLVTDQATEFHSGNVLGFLHQLNIDFQPCPAGKPWFKAAIERVIGTIMRGMAHKVPGTTYSNIQQKGMRDPMKAASLDIDDFTYLLMRYIVDDYNVRPHKALGYKSPKQVWDDAVERGFKPSMPPRHEELGNLVRTVVYRNLTQTGVDVGGLRYCAHSSRLMDLINRADKPKRVAVHVNPDNLSSVEIEDWNTHERVIVPSVDPEYTTGLTMAAHKYYSSRRRERIKAGQKITIQELIETRYETHQIMTDLVRRGKRRSKKLHQLLNGDPMPPVKGKRTKKQQQELAEAANENTRRATSKKTKKAALELRDEFDEIEEVIERGNEHGLTQDLFDTAA